MMLVQQRKLILSNFSDIYEAVVPRDNLLRRIKNLVNFEFIYEELRTEYCLDNGRNAIDPIVMFKYLLLKTIYDVSDVNIVERSRYDMSFKYFLDMAPEDEVINPSSLTKFRKLRLKNSKLLDLLINKTVEIALEKNIIKSKSIIVDSTHTRSKYNQKSPIEMLIDASKNLRKSVYKIDDSMKIKFPEKVTSGKLEDELEYCKKLIKVIKGNETISFFPAVSGNINTLSEIIEEGLNNFNSINDVDAKVGHKSVDTAFFGYKTHLAITEERIITAAVVTTGDKNDGKQLGELVTKSKIAGIDVKTIIGDAAYSEKENIEYALENEIALVSKLSKTVTHGNARTSGEFEYNKDADMYVCKAGNMSVRKTSTRKKKHDKEGTSAVISYFFDIEKCKYCTMRSDCYKDGSKTKSYSVTLMSNTHKVQAEFQETEYFKKKAKERYKIEAKNSEIKHSHGYDVSTFSGLIGMEMQGALTIFTVNLKRILKLIE